MLLFNIFITIKVSILIDHICNLLLQLNFLTVRDRECPITSLTYSKDFSFKPKYAYKGSLNRGYLNRIYLLVSSDVQDTLPPVLQL